MKGRDSGFVVVLCAFVDVTEPRKMTRALTHWSCHSGSWHLAGGTFLPSKRKTARQTRLSALVVLVDDELRQRVGRFYMWNTAAAQVLHLCSLNECASCAVDWRWTRQLFPGVKRATPICVRGSAGKLGACDNAPAPTSRSQELDESSSGQVS